MDTWLRTQGESISKSSSSDLKRAYYISGHGGPQRPLLRRVTSQIRSRNEPCCELFSLEQKNRRSQAEKRGIQQTTYPEPL